MAVRLAEDDQQQERERQRRLEQERLADGAAAANVSLNDIYELVRQYQDRVDSMERFIRGAVQSQALRHDNPAASAELPPPAHPQGLPPVAPPPGGGAGAAQPNGHDAGPGGNNNSNNNQDGDACHNYVYARRREDTEFFRKDVLGCATNTSPPLSSANAFDGKDWSQQPQLATAALREAGALLMQVTRENELYSEFLDHQVDARLNLAKPTENTGGTKVMTTGERQALANMFKAAKPLDAARKALTAARMATLASLQQEPENAEFLLRDFLDFAIGLDDVLFFSYEALGGHISDRCWSTYRESLGAGDGTAVGRLVKQANAGQLPLERVELLQSMTKLAYQQEKFNKMAARASNTGGRHKRPTRSGSSQGYGPSGTGGHYVHPSQTFNIPAPSGHGGGRGGRHHNGGRGGHHNINNNNNNNINNNNPFQFNNNPFAGPAQAAGGHG